MIKPLYKQTRWMRRSFLMAAEYAIAYITVPNVEEARGLAGMVVRWT